MIEEGSTEEVKLSILAHLAWEPTQDDVGRAAQAFRAENLTVYGGDVVSLSDNKKVEDWRQPQFIERGDLVVRVIYGFARKTEVQRARYLTVRAARNARLYPCQWQRVSIGSPILNDLAVKPGSEVYQVWLRELCK